MRIRVSFGIMVRIRVSIIVRIRGSMIVRIRVRDRPSVDFL